MTVEKHNTPTDQVEQIESAVKGVTRYKQLPDGEGQAADVDTASGTSVEKMADLAQSDAQPRLCFSKLLAKAVEHAESSGSPAIFDGPVLQVIVQSKWQQVCKLMYLTKFVAYIGYILSFTVLCLTLDLVDESSGSAAITTSASGSNDTTGDTLMSWLSPTLWAIVAVNTGLVLFYELRQALSDGVHNYLKDPWNYLDLAAALLVAVSLYLMRASTGGSDEVYAVAGFLCWFKVLFFLRGLDQTAFLVSMLSAIVLDTTPFLVVLLVLMIGFAFAFFMLQRGQKQNDSLFVSFPGSSLAVFDMGIMGDFDVDVFRLAPNWFIGVPLFVTFIVMVPIVMLNSLIAIMSDTFERVQQNTTAASRQERAKIILELEALLYPQLTAGGDKSSIIQQVLCVLLSRKFGTTSPPFLHVLEPKNRDSEDGGEWQGRIRVLFTKFDKAERAQQQLDATVKTQAAAVNEQVAAVNEQVAAVQTKMDQMQADTEKQATTAQSKMQTMEDKIDQMQAEAKDKMDQMQAVLLQAILAASQMSDAERSAAEEVRRVEKAEAETGPEPEPETKTENEDEEEPEPEQ
jgi:hypothetical protein